MKKNYFTALLVIGFGLLTVSKVNAQKQKHTDRYYNSWRLGINAGAMWQTADVRRDNAGFAGGFTLEKGLLENKTHFFSLAIRGRALWGNTYGLDYSRNYNVYNDPALNGKYNPGVNYDSVAANGGAPFIYNNFKTKIAEGSLELQIGFNRLRERTNILLNLWGGIGFTSYRTKVNLLNDKNKMYNYFEVDSSGSHALALSSHNFLLDNSYESYGNNSQNGNVLTWSPSCGVGFGYRFNDHISLLWEYKLTFPQGAYADYLDGIEKHNNDWIGCNKDYYHYTGLNLLIKLGKGKGGSSSHTNVDNYSNATTNTVVTTPTTGIVATPTQSVITSQPLVQKPIVNITNPPYSPYNETANKNFTINATVQHVSHRSEVNITFNGNVVTNYTWLGRFISFIEPLNVGNNVITVTATNNAGSDSKSAVINYSGVPPQITITSPGNEKVTSTQSNADIIATILNVDNSQNIAVMFNGQPNSAWSYDVNSKQFSMNAALITGTNTVDITATNLFGKDQKAQLIIYKPAVAIGTGTASRVLSVTITDPAVDPYRSVSAMYKVKAKVIGVNSQSQVTVTANSVQVPFTYVTGNVTVDLFLNSGNTLVQVSASNGKMSDSKSVTLTYEGPRKITPPTVVIVNPNPSPSVTNMNTYPFKAKTTYINDRSQLEVKYNGNIISNYSFDATQGTIDYNANLTLNSNNILEVKATNSYSTASASAIVKQEQPKTKVICHHVSKIKSETITITENEWPEHQAHGDSEGPCATVADDPAITICHNNGDGSKQTLTILQSQWALHQAHGDVMGSCPKIVNETPDNDITICHNNGNGTKQTIVIKESTWPSHQAHGDVRGACPKIVNETPDNDITICHNNGDGTKQTIVIKESTWPSHQAHGDVRGACPKIVNETPDNDITICHNNGDGTKQTIVIKESTWPSHQAHGDVKGACPKVMGSEDLDPDMVICHKNSDGSFVKMTIKTSQWSSHQSHGDVIGGNCTSNTNTTTPTNTVEICHNNGDGTKSTIVIPLDQFSAHRAHGDVMGKCPPLTNTVTVDPPITICHNNGDGSKTTMTIVTSQWAAHSGHGDVQGVCPVQTPTVEPEGRKIQICHIPPGNHQNPQTIEIPESAWPAHEAHGDAKVPCAPGEKKITICHIPPGNPNNPQTIEIAESAWPAHAAHGDTKGSCTPQENSQDPGKGKGKSDEGGNGKGNGNGNENNGNNGNGITPGRTMPKSVENSEPPKTPTPQPQQQTEGIKLRPR